MNICRRCGKPGQPGINMVADPCCGAPGCKDRYARSHVDCLPWALRVEAYEFDLVGRALDDMNGPDDTFGDPMFGLSTYNEEDVAATELLRKIFTGPEPRKPVRDLDQSDVDADGERAAEANASILEYISRPLGQLKDAPLWEGDK
jgi:hypothetical protein